MSNVFGFVSEGSFVAKMDEQNTLLAAIANGGGDHQLQQERKKTAQLQSSLDKANADIEYIAMMADIELDEETEVEDHDAQ